MKKKLVLALLSTSILSTMLAGCKVSTDTGATNTNSNTTETKEATSTDTASTDAAATETSGDETSGDIEEITWAFWDNLETTEDLISKGYKDVVDRYNETYKGKYHVNVVTTNLDEYTAKINAMVAAGETPDVFICNPGPNLTQYVDAGVAADLTDILNNEEKDWYNTFSDGIFEKITYDGKIMAVPTCFAAACVFYNTEIFEEAGIANPPETLDELLDDCEKIKAIGKTPITCSAGTPWCLSMVAGYLCDREGGPDNLQNVLDQKGKWTDDSFIRAGQDLQKVSAYFQETAAGDSNDMATANFYNGDAAMLIQGSWAIGQINGSNPEFEDKCGVFRFPAVTGGADPNRMIVKTDNLVMSANTEHKDACIALMKMFTDDESQKYIAEVGGKIPVTGVDFDTNKAPKQLSYVKNILASTTGTFGFYNESLGTVEAGDTFDNAMVEIFLGTATPEEAFQKVQDYFDKNMYK